MPLRRSVSALLLVLSVVLAGCPNRGALPRPDSGRRDGGEGGVGDDQFVDDAGEVINCDDPDFVPDECLMVQENDDDAGDLPVDDVPKEDASDDGPKPDAAPEGGAGDAGAEADASAPPDHTSPDADTDASADAKPDTGTAE